LTINHLQVPLGQRALLLPQLPQCPSTSVPRE
jgi:hypothetical protein